MNMPNVQALKSKSVAKKRYLLQLSRNFKRYKFAYIMVLPVILYYLIFYYQPMYGAIIAFKDFKPILGITGSPWVGLENFTDFFSGYYFWRLLKNTFAISVSSILFGFPAPIILAILINEIRSKAFSRITQTITYLPHFISLVVICSLIREFTDSKGFIVDLIELFGGQRTTLLNNPNLFVPIYVASDIWQNVGWGSIIYLAAITSIDPQLYEAAIIDGAGRWKQTLYVTLPGIAPTIVTLFILRMGGVLNVGFEKIILLYNPITYQTADVISSYVYRKGLQEFNYSFSAAVGLFNSLINFCFLISANILSRKINSTSLW